MPATATRRKPRTERAEAVTLKLDLPPLKKGEHYAGIILGKDGAHGDHVILLPGEANSVTWEQAKAWAKKIGGELPTRREQSLLYANLQEQFKPAWYWSGEQHAAGSGSAWVQTFGYGDQSLSLLKSFINRARAVRRVPLVIR